MRAGLQCSACHVNHLVAFGETDVGRDENQAAGEDTLSLIGFAEADR